MRGRWVSTVAALVAAVVGVVLWAAPSEASTPARKTTRAQQPAKPAAPATSWTVDRARFELLDPSGQFDLPGTGSYRGSITVRPSTGGSGVAAVNEVGLDDYVRGIAEMPATWPAEALKAQAIAARTYALNQLGTGHELCATDACQVYAGLAKEQGDPTGAWAQAVTATSGQVLLYKNAPILAMYSSSNGGQMVAGSRPYLRAGADPDDAVSPLSHWQSAMSFAALTGVFATPGPVIGIAKTAHDTFALAWQAPDASGAVGQLEVPTSDFMAKINASQPAPSGLPDMLPSGRFGLLVDPAAMTVTFDGRGFGHGIGMSQFGALGKATRGMKAADILAAYYGGLRPSQLASQQLPAVVPITVANQAASVQVSSPGRFRVVDGAGSVLAAFASGTWQVTPAGGGKVRVTPPADQQGAMAITPLAVTPPPAITAANAASAVPVALSFRLSLPALVRLTVQAPGVAPVSVPAQAFEAGDRQASILVPAPPTGVLPSGPWAVTIDADAGGGRIAAAPVGFNVGDPAAAATPTAGASADGRPPLLFDLLAMAGPVDSHPSRAPRSAFLIGLACLLGSAAVVLTNAIRFFQLRLDPGLR